MKLSSLIVPLAMALLWILLPSPSFIDTRLSGGSRTWAEPGKDATRKSPVQSHPAAATFGAHVRSREIMEKEAALKIKEEEMNKVSASLDARMKELDEKRKSLEGALSAKKKDNGERYKKMIKLYKTLKPEEAAGLMDKLDEETALEMMNRMDTKTVAKLVPFLNQKRVLKWTQLSLRGN